MGREFPKSWEIPMSEVISVCLWSFVSPPADSPFWCVFNDLWGFSRGLRLFKLCQLMGIRFLFVWVMYVGMPFAFDPCIQHAVLLFCFCAFCVHFGILHSVLVLLCCLVICCAGTVLMVHLNYVLERYRNHFVLILSVQAMARQKQK